MGQYSDKIKREYESRGLSPAQISGQKNTRTKTRNSIRREENRGKNKEIMGANSKLTAQERIEKLDWKLGKNIGAKRERARLLKKKEEISKPHANAVIHIANK